MYIYKADHEYCILNIAAKGCHFSRVFHAGISESCDLSAMTRAELVIEMNCLQALVPDTVWHYLVDLDQWPPNGHVFRSEHMAAIIHFYYILGSQGCDFQLYL